MKRRNKKIKRIKGENIFISRPRREGKSFFLEKLNDEPESINELIIDAVTEKNSNK